MIHNSGALTHRAAADIHARHINTRHPLRGWDDLVTRMLREAFALGAIWGLERAKAAVALTRAALRLEQLEQEVQP